MADDHLTRLLKASLPTATVSLVGTHLCSGDDLPIYKADTTGTGNVDVPWFAYNYSFFFLAIILKKAIPAPLLYPISAFLHDYGQSGHVNTEVGPPITNYTRLYHTLKLVRRFGISVGGVPLAVTLVLKYLEAASLLDARYILNVCLNKTRYGKKDTIDSNYIDRAELSRLLGFTNVTGHYESEILGIESRVISRLHIKWGYPESVVTLELKEPFLLPGIGYPAEPCIAIKDTRLTNSLSHETVSTLSSGIGMIPWNTFTKNPPDGSELSEIGAFHSKSYNVHSGYNYFKKSTSLFSFNVPNPLDAALLAYFFLNIMAPALESVVPTA